MEISFRTRKLERVMTDAGELVKHYGSDQARRIQARLLDLRDAPNLAILAKLSQTRVHELKRDRAGQISIDVRHPYRLLVKPDYDHPPRKSDGGLDWALVSKVVVLEIVDTH